MPKERKVNAKFIEEKLIPFILREQGRGFQMAQWIEKVNPTDKYYHDDLEMVVKSPACGTAACIGGSVQVLAKKRTPKSAAEFLGLTEEQGQGLFYEWSPYSAEAFCWPTDFADMFAKANTPYRKALVAVKLLREVIRTNGECLGSGAQQS